MKKQQWTLRLLAVGLVALAGLGLALTSDAEAATTGWCQDSCAYIYQDCTTACVSDYVGWGRGVCLRWCRADYNECLANC